MMDKTNINRLISMIGNASAIAVITHMKPDGDAMGSSLAMYRFLKAYFSADVSIVLNDRYPQNLAFMVKDDEQKDILIHNEDEDGTRCAIAGADLIICLDFNAFHRTDRLEPLLAGASCSKILIDHHLSPDEKAFDLVFSDTSSSSASELLYHILKETPQCAGSAAGIPLDAAEALMTGMTTDTNNFSNSATPATFAMASELIAMGVDRNRILSNLFNQFGENRLRLLGTVLKDLMTITEDGVSYIVLDAETIRRYGIDEGDTEGFVNMPLSIRDIRMSLFLKEDGDRVRVSIRSKQGTSANRCARLYFNGGGHENAAGGRLYLGKEISDISQAGRYIEKHTHIFFTENEA